MPIYEYICTQCGNHGEVIQKATDAPLTTCDHCGGEVYRPISRTSFQLKGGGWYKDGYGSAGPPPADAAEKKSDSTPASDSTSTTADAQKKTPPPPKSTT